jgi:uncharacterized lipoprotein YddW (UPF0748 family)
LPPNHPLRAHPDWAVAYPAGTPDSRLYFDPGIPAARRFVEDSILDAVARYDLDGVDFDDFFYPYPEGGGHDFNDAASFATYGGGFGNKANWRRNNVDTMVRETGERIRALKPWVTFGISPFGIWRNSATDPTGSATHGLQSYDEIYVDSRRWVKEHWVDAIMPQLYWNIGNKPADYAVLVKWWSSVVAGTGVQLYIAHGDYRVGQAGAWRDPRELSRQLALSQHYGVQGSVHYNATSVRADALGAIGRYEQTYYATPALLPDMARLPVERPGTPGITRVRGDGPRRTITWRPGAAPRAASYGVYRINPGVATATLIGTTRTLSFVDDSPGTDPHYCVSGLDRSDHEGPLSAAV